MGQSTDAILVFGIEVGDEGENPFISEDDYDTKDEEWLEERESVMDYMDVIAKAEGYDYSWAGGKNSHPLVMVDHCSGDYPMYILGLARTHTLASRGSPEEIDPVDMSVTEEEIKLLRDFCEKYNIEYSEPKWLLCSMWD